MLGTADAGGAARVLRVLDERDRLAASQTSAAPRVLIAHRTRGRLRLRLDGGERADPVRLARYLCGVPGVRDASPGLASGSILVRFDPSVTSEAALVAAARASSRADWPDVAPPPETSWPRAAFCSAVLAAAIVDMLPAAATVGAVALTAIPSVRRAATAAARGRLTVDTLDVAAIAASLASSRCATAAFMTWLLTIGDLVLERTQDRARRAITTLMQLEVADAWRLGPDGQVERVSARKLRCGERVVVYTGERAPADGLIVDGAAMVDEKALTGESLPRERRPGDRVLAASVVVEGKVVIEVDHTGTDTAAARIVSILQGAGAKPMTLLENATRAADRLVVPTIALAVLAALLSGQIDRLTSVLITDFGTGIRITVPTTALTALTLAAREGILVKGGQYLERLSRADTIVFDKTGTLTRGEPAIVDARAVGTRPLEETLAYAAAAEAHQHHPVAVAVRRWVEERSISLPPVAVRNESSSIGKGMWADVDGARVMVGRRRLLEEHGIDVGGAAAARAHHYELGASSLFVAIDGRLEAVLGYADEPRDESAAVVRKLRRRNRHVVLMSGDVQRAAHALARRVGLDRVVAELLPEDKARELRAMQASHHVVAMVGDGINDAPALALADVGISLRGSTEVALETADVVLLEGGLARLPSTFDLADTAMRRVRKGLALVLAPNAVAIVLGALGLMPPALAAAVNNGSTVLAGLAALAPLFSAKRAATRGRR